MYDARGRTISLEEPPGMYLPRLPQSLKEGDVVWIGFHSVLLPPTEWARTHKACLNITWAVLLGRAGRAGAKKLEDV